MGIYIDGLVFVVKKIEILFLVLVFWVKGD